MQTPALKSADARELTERSGALDAALARTLDAALAAGRLDLVERVLSQLEARPRAPLPANVVNIATRRR